MEMIDVKCSLFYVDDDNDDLLLFKSAAEAIGENVCVFEFGQLMLHSLHNPPPNPSVVFVDLNMPTMNGFEVIKQIKMSPDLCHLPIVAYSTSANPADINRCRMLGVSMFVTKPANFKGIQQVIKHVISTDWNTFAITDKNFLYKF